MNARRVSRELALLALFQLEKKGGYHPVPHSELAALVLSAVRSLTYQAQENIESAVADFRAVSYALMDHEDRHPDNLERPMEAENKPVPIPTTREMLESLDKCLKAAELLNEAFRLPELRALSGDVNVQQRALTLVQTVMDETDAIDAMIQAASPEWRVDRLAKMDRTLLRVAVAEMKFVDDVDIGVSVNEAVELSKQFSEEDSYKLINGILGHVAGQLGVPGLGGEIPSPAASLPPEVVAQADEADETGEVARA